MLYLNFSNVEEIVFEDRKLQDLLPSYYFSIFEQWRLSVRMTFLRNLGKQAVLDFLNGLSDDDVAIIEEYLGKKIVVEKLNYSIAMNYKIPLSKPDICEVLCAVKGFGYFSTWRDDEHLYICVWR